MTKICVCVCVCVCVGRGGGGGGGYIHCTLYLSSYSTCMWQGEEDVGQKETYLCLGKEEREIGYMYINVRTCIMTQTE